MEGQHVALQAGAQLAGPQLEGEDQAHVEQAARPGRRHAQDLLRQHPPQRLPHTALHRPRGARLAHPRQRRPRVAGPRGRPQGLVDLPQHPEASRRRRALHPLRPLPLLHHLGARHPRPRQQAGARLPRRGAHCRLPPPPRGGAREGRGGPRQGLQVAGGPAGRDARQPAGDGRRAGGRPRAQPLGGGPVATGGGRGQVQQPPGGVCLPVALGGPRRRLPQLGQARGDGLPEQEGLRLPRRGVRGAAPCLGPPRVPLGGGPRRAPPGLCLGGGVRGALRPGGGVCGPAGGGGGERRAGRGRGHGARLPGVCGAGAGVRGGDPEGRRLLAQDGAGPPVHQRAARRPDGPPVGCVWR
mmetsp:Transcript_27379/g.69069  ORF Transcript_27379/g.69069 Transcript_27379/m.69069 type:complete len:355 (+) Transcript_27379:550-1614(+)